RSSAVESSVHSRYTNGGTGRSATRPPLTPRRPSPPRTSVGSDRGDEQAPPVRDGVSSRPRRDVAHAGGCALDPLLRSLMPTGPVITALSRAVEANPADLDLRLHL